MKWVVAVVIAAVGVLAAAPALAVDEPAPGALDLPVDLIDISRHPEVTITVTVPQELVGLNLQPEDFFVSEDNQARDVDVQQLPSDELAVVLVLDTSGSMRGAPLLAAKRAVESFLVAMPPGVQVALVSFGDVPEIVSQFTRDYDATLVAVTPLAADGETALYNGVLLGANLFDNISAERRAMVLLSDGGDTASSIALEDALIRLLDTSAQFVAVELQTSENDPAVLERLAVATGGSVVSAEDPAALTEIYETTASNLINQYELTYTSQSEGPTDVVVAVRRDDVAAIATEVVTFPPLPEAAPVQPQPTTAPEAEPIFVPAPPTATVEVPWIASSSGLIVGTIAVFGALAATFILMVPTRQGGLAFFGLVGRRPATGFDFSSIAGRATVFAEQALSKGHSDRSIRILLDRAGLRMRVGELAVLLLAVGLAVWAVAQLFLSLPIAIALGVGAVILVVAVISAIGSRRSAKFRDQLPDTLGLISGSLRAGFGLNTAFGAVAEEQDEPTRTEFGRMQIEVQLGRTIEDALRSAAARVQSEDLPWVADAIEIHRETGGDVADLLDGIAATVRERERIRGQIKVLSAEGRISGLVLVLMPFILAGVTYVAAPDYLAELTNSTAGRWMIFGASVGMAIGVAWILRIIRLKY